MQIQSALEGFKFAKKRNQRFGNNWRILGM